MVTFIYQNVCCDNEEYNFDEPKLGVQGKSVGKPVQELLTRQTEILRRARLQLTAARQLVADRVNKTRIAPRFAQGQKVLLKTEHLKWPGVDLLGKKLKPKKLQTVRSYGDPRDIVKTYKPAAAKKFGSKLVKGLSKLGPKGKAAAAVVGLGLGAYALTKAKFGKKKDAAGAGTGKTTKKNPSIQLNLGKNENKQT